VPKGKRGEGAVSDGLEICVCKLKQADPNPLPLSAPAAGATPLRRLAWLIEDPTDAAVLYRSGITVRIPRPARFAGHKLILAQKRGGDTTRRAKDLEQAGALIAALKAADRFALSDAFEGACAQGVTGRKRPEERSLAELGPTPDDLGA